MMAIVVPIDNSMHWKPILSSAIELSDLLPGNLEVVLADSDPQLHLDALTYVQTSGSPAANDVHFSNTVSAPENLAKLNQRTSVLVVPMRSNDTEVFGEFARTPLRWRGPILLVPPNLESRRSRHTDRMIVILSDRSSVETTDPWVSWIAKSGREQVFLLSVEAPDNEFELGERLSQAERRLSSKADAMRRRGLRTTWEVRIGHPTGEVIRLAETTGAQLIVIQRPRYDFSGETLLDALVDDGRFHVLVTV